MTYDSDDLLLDEESGDDDQDGVEKSSWNGRTKTVVAVTLALVSGVCHATSALFTVLAVNVGFSEFQIIFVSSAAGTLTSFIIVRLGQYHLLVDDGFTTFLLFANAVVMLLGDASYIYAVQWAPLGDTTTLVNASMPIMTALLAYVILNESWTIADAACSILSICGIILITYPSFVFNHTWSAKDNSCLEAYGLAVFAALCYSLSPVLTRKMMETSVFIIMFYQFSVHSLLSLPLMYIMERPNWRLNAENTGYLIVVTIFDVLELGMLFRSVQMESAPTVVLLSNIDVVVTYLYDHYILHKTLHPLKLVGAAMVLASSAMVAVAAMTARRCKHCRERCKDKSSAINIGDPKRLK